jgi:hypothetical protein
LRPRHRVRRQLLAYCKMPACRATPDVPLDFDGGNDLS